MLQAAASADLPREIPDLQAGELVILLEAHSSPACDHLEVERARALGTLAAELLHRRQVQRVGSNEGSRYGDRRQGRCRGFPIPKPYNWYGLRCGRLSIRLASPSPTNCSLAPSQVSLRPRI